MFLPESFQLPRGLRNPAAVYTNLNLHAGVICLHHAAIEKIQLYKLPDPLKRASELRLRGAAEEIVNIVRLSSHINPGFVCSPEAPSHTLSRSTYTFTEKPVGCPLHVLRVIGLRVRCKVKSSNRTLVKRDWRS